MREKKGSVLIITLWILAILVVFALGIGERAALSLRTTIYQKNRLEAGYLADAGVMKAIALLEKDPHSTLNGYDTLDSCGLGLAGRRPGEVFVQAWSAEADFKIGYFGADGLFYYGFQDEDSRVNLNGFAGVALVSSLTELFKIKNISDYDRLAKYAAAWINTDNEPESPFFKNQELERAAELIAILEGFYSSAGGKDAKEARKSARDVYNALKDIITVDALKMNINTASDDALRVLIRSAGGITDVGREDALLGKIKEIRASDGFQSPQGLSDQLEQIKKDNSALSDIVSSIASSLTVQSEFFRFSVVGQYRNAAKQITVVYNRKAKKIVSWHEK